MGNGGPKSPQIGFGRWRYEFDWLNSQSSRVAVAAIVSGVYALVAVLGVVGLMLALIIESGRRFFLSPRLV